MTRSIDRNIRTLAQTLGSAEVRESTIQVPAIGGMLGLILDLTEDAPDAGGTVTARRITAAINNFHMRDRAGRTIINLSGEQLERVANELSAVGDDVDAAVAGDGAAVTYERVIPISVSKADMPAQIDITWGPITNLYSVDTTAGGTAMTLNMRGRYTNDPVPTLRVKANTPNHAAGENYISPNLPDGEIVEKLLILPSDVGTNPLVDTDLDSVSLASGGFSMLDRATVDAKFSPEDTEYRRDGHNDGHINVRVPVFAVDSTTELMVDLGTDADFDLVTVSRIPQKAK